MRKLLIFASLITTIQASELYLAYGINTTHIKYGRSTDQYEFNENNNLIGFEIKNGKNLYSICKFNNSFYNDSFSINYRRKNGMLLYGLSVIKGYDEKNYLQNTKYWYLIEEFDNPLYIGNGYSVIPTIGLEYEFENGMKLESSLMTNAIVSTLKIKF